MFMYGEEVFFMQTHNIGIFRVHTQDVCPGSTVAYIWFMYIKSYVYNLRCWEKSNDTSDYSFQAKCTMMISWS